MLAFTRTILTLGSLAASVAVAEARADSARAIPLPPDRPLLLDVTSPSSPMSAGDLPRSPQGRGGRRGRQTEASAVAAGAPSTRAVMVSNTEPAAPTPSDSQAVASAGPHETGAPTLTDLVTRHARDNGVPVGLAEAVVRIESRGNPHASHGGALGLMQIKPATARAVGFNGGAAALFVADTNLHFGMKVLGDAYRSSGGDVCRALMLYQSGHLATRMTRSNRIYCSRARAIMAGV